MAMLAVVHRCNLGHGPPHFKQFFRRREEPGRRLLTRSDMRRHQWQLEDPRDGTHSELLARSVFGLIGVYNVLPDCSIGEPSVQLFQRALQSILKERASASIDGWAALYSPRQPLYSHPVRSLN